MQTVESDSVQVLPSYPHTKLSRVGFDDDRLPVILEIEEDELDKISGVSLFFLQFLIINLSYSSSKKDLKLRRERKLRGKWRESICVFSNTSIVIKPKISCLFLTTFFLYCINVKKLLSFSKFANLSAYGSNLIFYFLITVFLQLFNFRFTKIMLFKV